MKLSNKDFEFLLKLKSLFDNNEVEIELKETPFKYFVLRGNYGYNIESKFNISRQGIRWRFYRLFNLIYVSAYETIFTIEKNFGTSLRNQAIEISKQRYLYRHNSQVKWEQEQKLK